MRRNSFLHSKREEFICSLPANMSDNSPGSGLSTYWDDGKKLIGLFGLLVECASSCSGWRDRPSPPQSQVTH